MTYTETDFETLSWHDCHLYGIGLRTGDPRTNDWTSDLVLDLDFIAEWVCRVGSGGAQFRVAPATLVFHEVSDLRIAVDWGGSDYRAMLHPASMNAIEREAVAERQVRLGHPYYRWRISFNWPEGGEITFGAVGFTQTLRADPALSDAQRLPPSMRS